MTEATLETTPWSTRTFSTVKRHGTKAARVTKDKTDQWRKDEPVALATVVRLSLLAGMSFVVKMSPQQQLAVMTAVEAGLAYWTRRQVSPRHYDQNRRGVTTPADA